MGSVRWQCVGRRLGEGVWRDGKGEMGGAHAEAFVDVVGGAGRAVAVGCVPALEGSGGGAERLAG